MLFISIRRLLVGGLTLQKEPKGEVKFDTVVFAYPSRPECPILKNLVLVVPSGSITAVVGSSGSGKSTLAALLLRFYDPQKGSILLDGVPITTFDPVWLRSHIGTVSQVGLLFFSYLLFTNMLPFDLTEISQ